MLERAPDDLVLRHKAGEWWNHLRELTPQLAASGINALWLPPVSKAADIKSNGYDPYDYFDLGDFDQKGGVETWLGSKADLDQDHIKVDGKLIHAPKRLLYIALHKPDNTVTTVTDPEGRNAVMELLRGVKERVYPVGRLDYHSEGLLLLTNDGELANAVMSAASASDAEDI